MHRAVTLTIITLAALAVSLPALAQDRDSIQVREKGAVLTHQCKLLSISAKEVSASVYNNKGKRRKRTFKSTDVVRIDLASARKSAGFVDAEDAFKNGRYGDAVKRFASVVSSEKNPIVKQIAYHQYAMSAYNARQYAQAVQVVKSFVTAYPTTYFLDEVYKVAYKASLANRDLKGAQSQLKDFAAKSRSAGRPDWAKLADVYSADILERQGNHKQALAVYSKNSRAPGQVGIESAVGELRCLAATKQWSQARSRGDALVREGAARRGTRVLTAAYNALGDYFYHQEKNLKEALMSYLRGIAEFEGPDTYGTPEHAKSLGMSAILFAEFGANAGGETKDSYMQRAQELKGELSSRYTGHPLGNEIERKLRELR